MRVFLFPGQGSQEVGMGADLFESDPVFRDLVALASELAQVDLWRICQRGPERELVKTQHLQPLLVAVSLGYTTKLLAMGITPDLALGHSLGEVAALAAAGVVSFEDAVRVAAKRGQVMAAAAAKMPGGMLAAVSSDREQTLDLLAPLLTGQSLFVANDNAPSQLLVSGTAEAVAQAASLLAAARVPARKLPVAGPWHTPFMKEAQTEFANWLQGISFSKPRVPLLMNVTARTEVNPENIRHLLVRSLTEPVQWRSSMGSLKQLRPGVLFEIGPGRVLAGLARANGVTDDVRIINVNHERGLALAKEWLCSRSRQTSREPETADS